MTQETKKRIHLAYGIAVGAVSILAGICLIAACCNIYYSGVASGASQIYTRQIVVESFSKIAIPVYSCLVLVIGGMILNMALPIEKKKLKPEKNLPFILQKLQEKTDLDACDEQLRNAVSKEQKLRNILCFVGALPLAHGFIQFCKYGIDPAHWGSNSTPSMVKAMYVMLAHLAVPFICSIIVLYRNRKSMEKEIELMRQAAAQAPKAVEKSAPKARSNRAANIARITILVVAVLLVWIGARDGGTVDILTKAVNICTECVGLG